MPKHSQLALGLTLLLTVIITALTLTPISAAPEPVEHSDKIYHVLGFAALAFPISFFRPSWLLIAVPTFAGFGGLIEIIQPYVGRECSLHDWFADLVGIALGVICGRSAGSLVPLMRRP